MPAKKISKGGLDPSVQYVLNRLVVDPNFRKRFESDREGALQGIDLTPSQRAAFKRFRAEELVERVRKLKDIAGAAIGSIYI